MISEGAQDLFRRAIIQERAVGHQSGASQDEPKAMLKIAARVAHDAPTDDVIAAQAAVVSASQGFGWPASMPFGTQYGHHPLPAEDRSRLRMVAMRASLRCADWLDGGRGLVLHPHHGAAAKVGIPAVAGRYTFVVWSSRTITRKVYAVAVDRFAKRHARAGGRAYTYKIHWGSKTNQLGATHAIDLPLLFGDEETWRDADSGGRSRLARGACQRPGKSEHCGHCSHGPAAWNRV